MKKLLLKIAIFFRYLMRGLHSADVEAFEGKTEESKDGVNAEQQQETNNVYQNLLKGELTQEVKELRYEMYQAERKSYEYRYNGGGTCEKKENVAQPKNIDINDSETLYLIQSNEEDSSTLNDYDIIWDGGISVQKDEKKNYGDRLIHDYRFNIERDFLPRYRIEEFTDKLVVKKIKDKFILDFYSSLYKDIYNKRQSMFIKEIEKIKNGDKRNDIIDFKSLSFATDNAYGFENLKEFSFGNLIFKEIAEYDGFYIIRFVGDVIKDGIDLTDEFYNEIADRKNRNHELRDGATLNLDTLINNEDDFDADKALELVGKIED